MATNPKYLSVVVDNNGNVIRIEENEQSTFQRLFTVGGQAYAYGTSNGLNPTLRVFEVTALIDQSNALTEEQKVKLKQQVLSENPLTFFDVRGPKVGLSRLIDKPGQASRAPITRVVDP